MTDDAKVASVPNMDIPSAQYLLELPDSVVPNKMPATTKILKFIEDGARLPYYLHLVELLGWEKDGMLVSKLEKINKEKLAEMDAAVKDAEENEGENEVREALLKKANYLCDIGDKKAAVFAYRVVTEKTVAQGQRLDILFSLIRLGFFYSDLDLAKRNIEKTRTALEMGAGDWDRKNRLKVYEAIYLLFTREFKAAAKLFLETVSSFTSTELISYEGFIYLALLASAVSLPRVDLKKKVLDSPEILAVIDQIPYAGRLVGSFYSCDYKKFFVALANVTQEIKKNRFVGPHSSYFCRELRIRAYSQLLESYKSVTLSSMAAAFGVSSDFLDTELSRFIYSGRLFCKIDKVSGVVETTRPNEKNSLYKKVIQKGDLLLNRIQKLSHVINL